MRRDEAKQCDAGTFDKASLASVKKSLTMLTKNQTEKNARKSIFSHDYKAMIRQLTSKQTNKFFIC